MQPKYIMRKSKEHKYFGYKVSWKLFVSKRKTIPGQPNPENSLTEEIASYKAVMLT
jgi:hypothetical protein